jgi:hypothetical protein
MAHSPFALPEDGNSEAENEKTMGKLSLEFVLQTTALLVARAPGLYFSEPSLSMKLLKAGFKPPLQQPVHIEFPRCLCKFELAHVRTRDKFIA